MPIDAGGQIERETPAGERGEQLVRDLRGRATVAMSTAEIMVLTRDHSIEEEPKREAR